MVVQDSFDDFQPTRLLVQCKGPRTCWSGPAVWVTSTLGPQELPQSFWEDQVVCTLNTYHLPALGCGLVIEKPLEGDRKYMGKPISAASGQSIHIGIDACHGTF